MPFGRIMLIVSIAASPDCGSGGHFRIGVSLRRKMIFFLFEIFHTFSRGIRALFVVELHQCRLMRAWSSIACIENRISFKLMSSLINAAFAAYAFAHGIELMAGDLAGDDEQHQLFRE